MELNKILEGLFQNFEVYTSKKEITKKVIKKVNNRIANSLGVSAAKIRREGLGLNINQINDNEDILVLNDNFMFLCNIYHELWDKNDNDSWYVNIHIADWFAVDGKMKGRDNLRFMKDFIKLLKELHSVEYSLRISSYCRESTSYKMIKKLEKKFNLKVYEYDNISFFDENYHNISFWVSDELSDFLRKR